MKHIGDELAEIVKPFDPVPIPTKYQGVEFRSRLEARWAVFMDAIGVRWFYEFEGYKFGDVWYLPDFYLPDLKCWVEIKANEPSREEHVKARCLADGTGKRVFLAWGEPGNRPEDNSIGSSMTVLDYHGEDFGYRFCSCQVCGRVGIEFEGRGDRICKGTACYETRNDRDQYPDKGYTFDFPIFVNAARKALTERFW